jgi:glycosyltransferase involved in cell wall biosynthesis
MYTYTERKHERGVPACVSVGRVTPIKKIDIALRVLVLYTEKFSQKLSLDIVGPDTDHIYKASLESYIQGNNLHSQVTFCGGKTAAQMYALYEHYDILIHPAYEAGFDKVVLEAMATGVIPITSISSFESILKPFGLFVSAHDAEGYMEVIHRIACLNQKEKNALREKLRDIVVENHSITTLPKRIFNVF